MHALATKHMIHQNNRRPGREGGQLGPRRGVRVRAKLENMVGVRRDWGRKKGFKWGTRHAKQGGGGLVTNLQRG